MPASPPQGSGGGGGTGGTIDMDVLTELVNSIISDEYFSYKGIFLESQIDTLVTNGSYEIDADNDYLLVVFHDIGSVTRIVQVRYYPDGSIEWRNQTDGTTWSAWRDIWTSASDGTGSGLDADLLDGNHAAAFATAGHNHDGTYSPTGHNHDGTYSPVGHNHDGTYSPVGHNHDSDYADIAHTHALDDLTDVIISNPATGQCLVYSGTGWVNGGGTGSGLDADLLDGNHAAAFATSGHNHDLDSLSDVVITTPIDGQILKRVSGTWVNASGGGSDADTLDGYHASSFVLASDYEDSDVLAKVKNVDGTGSGLDADTVDGSHASSFASSGHTHGLDDLTDVEISNPATGQFLKYDGSKWGNSALGTIDADTLDGSHASAFAASGHNHDSDYVKLTDYEDTDLLTKIKNVDGTTSGLDADLLDGYHSSSFATSGHNHDGTYAPSVHNHDGTYSPVGHLHDDRYVLTSDYEDSDVLTKIKNVDGTGSGLDADTLDGNEATDFARYKAVTTTVGAASAGWYRIAESTTYLVLRNPFSIAWGVTGVSHGNVTLVPQQSFEQGILLTQLAFSVYHNTGYGITQARLVYSDTGADKSYLEIYSDGIANYDLYVSEMIYWNNWTVYATPTAGSIPSGYSAASITFTGAINSTGKLYSEGTEVSKTGHAHAGTDITSGTIDGDRLPAISSSKKGGVPATGTPSGLFLKDDGTWASAGGGGTGAARLSTVYKSVTFNTSSNDDVVTDSVDLGTSYGTITRIRVYATQTMGQRTPGQFLVNAPGGLNISDTTLVYDTLTGTLPTAGAEGTGDYIWIDNELIRVASGTSTPLTIVRGLGGTRAAFHDDNSVIRTANDGLRLALFNNNSYVFTNAFLELSNLLTGAFTTNSAITSGVNYLVCTTSPAVLPDFGLGDCILIDDTTDEYAYVQAVLGAVAGTTYDNTIFTRDTLSAHDNTKPVYRVIEYNQPITFKLTDGDDLLYFSLAANQLLPGNMTVYLEFLVEKWD